MTLLTDADLRRFARDGYLVIPYVVSEPLLAAADTEVDALLDEVEPNEGTGGPGPNLWFPPPARLPRCDAVLRESPVLAIAEQLVAPHSLDHAFDHIQVATTVPPYTHVPGGPHIDGHGPGQDPPASFTMLAGVLLTEQRTEQSGNLWVWPGSHVHHQQLFQELGAKVLQKTGGHSTMLDPPPALNPAVEVKGGRGDLLLAHYLLGHNKGGNTATHVRRTIYFRLAVPGHTGRWESTFLDPWTEFAPVRRAIGVERSSRIEPGC